MNAQTKCLVSGAAGFIGSHLIDQLLARGATVLGFDNMRLGRRANLAGALENPRFKFVEMDANNVAEVSRLVAAESKDKSFDIAWHLAANSDIRAGVSATTADKAGSVNIAGGGSTGSTAGIVNVTGGQGLRVHGSH